MGIHEPMRRALRVLVVLGTLALLAGACSGSDGPFEKVSKPVTSYKLPRAFSRITPGRSSFLVTATGSRGYPGGMTVFRLSVEGTRVRATAPVRIGRSTHFAGGDALELPDGGWLITSDECDGELDDLCDTEPTHVIRVESDGSVHEVARLKGRPGIAGVLDAHHVVLERRESTQTPAGDNLLDITLTSHFSTLDLRTGRETEVAWTPPVMTYRQSTVFTTGDEDPVPPVRRTCATQDRLLSLFTPGTKRSGDPELTVVDISTGKASAPRPVTAELHGWPTLLCRPDGTTTIVTTDDVQHRADAYPVDAGGRVGTPAEAPIAFGFSTLSGGGGSLLVTSQDMPTAADNIAALGRPDLMAALAKREQTISLLALTDGAWRTLPVVVLPLQRPFLSGDGRQLLVQDGYRVRGIAS